VREGRNRKLQYSVDRNSDINTQGNDGMLPLDFGVLNGNMKMTHIVLERNEISGKSSRHIVAAAIFGIVKFLQRFCCEYVFKITPTHWYQDGNSNVTFAG
jgi:hypothetical protein